MKKSQSIVQGCRQCSHPDVQTHCRNSKEKDSKSEIKSFARVPMPVGLACVDVIFFNVFHIFRYN